MARQIGLFAMFIFIFCFYTGYSYADSSGNGRVNIPGMAVVTASSTEAAPEWAVMQRQLIKTMEEAIPFYLNRFTRRGGTLYGSGPWDDVAEMFYNWSLCYGIGADEKLLNTALEEFNALIRQSTNDNQLYKEFAKSDDWFHISEGLMAFYDLAIGDPAIPENVDRAKRFAGFYMNEDPECTKNYDPVNKLIPYISSGSKGPSENFGAEYMINYGHASLYPRVKENIEPYWGENPKRRKEITTIYNDVVNRCDVPVNLGAVGLVTNAYLYTGDEKYKKWVLEYVDAWIVRIKQNNGIIPDNIGQSGKIGEYRKGQWWGGFFGWSGRYSIHMIFSALTLATECANLVSGDPKYLYLLRSQIDVLLGNSKITKEGQLVVPYKYGSEGWYSYRPMRIFDLSHLWNESMDPSDWQRIEKVMNGSKYYPPGYSGQWGENMFDANDTQQYVPGEPFDCNYVPSEGDRNIDYPTEFPRIAYYAGKNPDWPLKIMKADYKEVVSRMEFMRNDTRDIYSINADDLYPNNPVITKGLIQVTMGAPQTVYNGGLLRARVRYYDIDRARPGLPSDVAALVERLEDKLTTVRLVNLSIADTRKLIIQAGAFGEHDFLDVKYQVVTLSTNRKKSIENKTIPVNSKYLAVVLPPSTTITLEMGMRRFVNKPAYAFPWQSDTTLINDFQRENPR
jgi:hypothetical protein